MNSTTLIVAFIIAMPGDERKRRSFQRDPLASTD